MQSTSSTPLRFNPGWTAAENVIAGWMGVRVPPIPKHRRRPYHKTTATRPKRKVAT
ncbi:MAG TPA: hypothetical protein VGG82_07820 [Casimicrobiaceae bacterium]